jgi:hypothetical protein
LGFGIRIRIEMEMEIGRKSGEMELFYNKVGIPN